MSLYSLNEATLIGYLGKVYDTTESNSMSMYKFSLGVANDKKVNGEWVKSTDWFTIVCFGRLADQCKINATKGRQIYIRGTLQTNNWKDKTTGFNRVSYSIIALNVVFLGSKNSNIENQNTYGIINKEKDQEYSELKEKAISEKSVIKEIDDIQKKNNTSEQNYFNKNFPF